VSIQKADRHEGMQDLNGLSEDLKLAPARMLSRQSLVIRRQYF